MTENINRVLVMTVGTGDFRNLEDSLFTPLRKSIATDAWARIILLPSSATETFAKTVTNGIEGVAVAIRPLPEGDENDADRAYNHFDSVLAAALQESPPGDVVVDFTRGTKAMSAALVLAATRREIPHLRYIVGPRDGRGMVIAGAEAVHETRTTVVTGHRRIDLARALMQRGNFPAAEAVLPAMDRLSAELHPEDLIATAGAVRTAALFYAAWDRLDYVAAARADIAASPNDDWNKFWPGAAARKWVRSLAEETERSDSRAMAARLRRLMVDLLANGERRLRQGQHEDALVRVYRVLELIGQARLFDYGLDSGNLCPNHPAVTALQRKIKKRNQEALGIGRNGELLAGRFQVARILKACGDPLASRLLQFENEALLKPRLRNNSLLIHGFVARAPEDPESLSRLFTDLAQLIRDDGNRDTVDEWLSVARSPTFGSAVAYEIGAAEDTHGN